jgi:hypothetical protein
VFFFQISSPDVKKTPWRDEQLLTVWQWIATAEGLGFHIFPSSTVHKVDVSMDVHRFSGIKIIHNHPESSMISMISMISGFGVHTWTWTLRYKCYNRWEATHFQQEKTPGKTSLMWTSDCVPGICVRQNALWKLSEDLWFQGT